MSYLLKLEQGGLVTIIAMGIVFVVLIVLMYVIRLQTAILKDRKKQSELVKADNNSLNTVKDLPSDTQNPTKTNVVVSNDEEIVAAIVAAICNYTNLSSSDFKIKSIKRMSGNESQWRRSGIL